MTIFCLNGENGDLTPLFSRDKSNLFVTIPTRSAIQRFLQCAAGKPAFERMRAAFDDLKSATGRFLKYRSKKGGQICRVQPWRVKTQANT
jgi:hypothetical protein